METVGTFIGLAGALESIVERVSEFLSILLDTPIALIYMAACTLIITLAVRRSVIG